MQQLIQPSDNRNLGELFPNGTSICLPIFKMKRSMLVWMHVFSASNNFVIKLRWLQPLDVMIYVFKFHALVLHRIWTVYSIHSNYRFGFWLWSRYQFMHWSFTFFWKQHQQNHQNANYSWTFVYTLVSIFRMEFKSTIQIHSECNDGKNFTYYLDYIFSSNIKLVQQYDNQLKNLDYQILKHFTIKISYFSDSTLCWFDKWLFK